MQEVSVITKELVDSLNIVPVNKFLVVRPEKIDSGKRIILSGDKSEMNAGQALMVVDNIDPACTLVKKGDRVIAKFDAKSMAEFKILDDTYFMINEEDVAIVLRK